MAQKRRNRRRGQAKAANQSQQQAEPVYTDRYQKFLPEWMRGLNGAAPPRPARPRRARPQRPAGGYTPGKLVHGDR